jgi:hypothetical protein
MPALADVIPAAGLGSVIVVLTGYLLRALANDRSDFRERIAEERARTVAAESRLAEERARADAAEDRTDAETVRRRQAEEACAVAVAEMRGMTAYWARASSGGGPVGGPPPVPQLGSWPDSQVQ